MTSETKIRRVLLLLEKAKNRELLESWFDDQSGFAVTPPASKPVRDTSFDLCVLDDTSFPRYRTQIQAKKQEVNPTFLPVLLVHAGSDSQFDFDPFSVVDDIIEVPIVKDALSSRVDNLIQRRRLSQQLYEQFERSEQRFERIFESTNDAIFVIDVDADEVIECNPSACALVGYSRNHLLSLSPTEDLHPDDPASYESFVNHVREAGQGWIDELTYKTKGGRRLMTEVSAAAIDASDRSTVILCVRDITLRKRRQQQVQILNRVLRHNLRNDMNIIHGYANQLASILDDDSAMEHLRRITDTSEGLTELADKTKDLHKAVTWKQDPRPIDTTETIVNVCQNLEVEYPEAIVRIDQPEEAWVAADDRLDQAVRELCENAIKHSDDQEPTIDVLVSCADERVIIEIKDRGPGISDQELAVLEGEESPLHHGSGLGLWLVNWIVTSVGGDLALEDNESRGSTVTVALARADGDKDRPWTDRRNRHQ